MIIPRIKLSEEMLSKAIQSHSITFSSDPLKRKRFLLGNGWGLWSTLDQASKVRSSVLGSTGRRSPLGCREEEDWSLGRRRPSRPDPVLSERRSGSSRGGPSWALGCEFAATGLKERARMNMISQKK